jgi:hypothetical protein
MNYLFECRIACIPILLGEGRSSRPSIGYLPRCTWHDSSLEIEMLKSMEIYGDLLKSMEIFGNLFMHSPQFGLLKIFESENKKSPLLPQNTSQITEKFFNCVS